MNYFWNGFEKRAGIESGLNPVKNTPIKNTVKPPIPGPRLKPGKAATIPGTGAVTRTAFGKMKPVSQYSKGVGSTPV